MQSQTNLKFCLADIGCCFCVRRFWQIINPLNAKLNPICHLLALLGAHHILHVSMIKVEREET
jgi:hypothetical protein